MSTSDKGKGKAPEVNVVDFAHPQNLESGKVSEPQTQEDWNDFITKYTLGEYNNCSFTDDRPPSPPKPTRHSSDETGTTSATETAHPGSTAIASSSNSNSNSKSSSPIRHAPSLPPPPSRQSSHASNPAEEELQDRHPDTSNAGPSNQDPDIPNIDSPGNASSSSKEKGKRKDGEKEKEKEYKEQESVTTENMRQLSMEGEGETQGKVEKAKGRRRRRDHAELASPSTSLSVDSSESEDPARIRTRRRAPRQPRSRGSWSLRSKSPHGPAPHPHRRGTGPSLDNALLESGTNDSTSLSQAEVTYDHAKERERVKDFYSENGYMPAPRQTPEAARRRLRVIRRLGLEEIDPFHRETLDRFTRLASTVFKTKTALISILTKDKQIFLSEIGWGKSWNDLDSSFCCHNVITHTVDSQDGHCMVIKDTAQDWRFRKNPLVQEGQGPVQFYAGAQLKVGSGTKSTTIGSLCIFHDKPRDFSEDDKKLLTDLADCVVSELELIYSQQASIESAKLHQISVDFLRRSLKHRPSEMAGQSRTSKAGITNASGTGTGTDKTERTSKATSSTASSITGKRISGADQHQDESNVDIYDEACREVRNALDAYAVAVVDLSQFHLFYPTYQNSSTGGGNSTRAGSTSAHTRSQEPRNGKRTDPGTGTGTNSSSAALGDDDQDAYSKPNNVKRARATYAVTDPLAPSRTPQVLFIPSRRKSDPHQAAKFGADGVKGSSDNLAVLGYSCSEDGFAFNFTSAPAARKVISDFIASNVKTRKVWYTRDDNEGVAQSITHLMPPGTETSMAMPVFGFDGQVAFAVVACWTDPLYTYPAGAMQFVETIAGSLLASVMKERLHRAERAQLNFAAAASHELRTPLHQINAAASLLRMALHGVLENEGDEMPKVSRDDRIEALAQLEIIEANGMSLGGILENIIDTLDIGKMASKIDQVQTNPDGTVIPPDLLRSKDATNIVEFTEVLENVVDDAMRVEAKSRRIATGSGLEDVEVILEVLPRHRGGWKMSTDPGPLSRALGKIVHNAVKFTNKGHVHITVQDVSRDVVLPGGFDNSIKLSTVSIDIKDTGRGMSSDFLDREVLRPFAKEDAFTPGSGLGLGLAQRMIELLGGKFAIASTLGKGTMVHIEVPVHLLNEDNDSDQDIMATGNDGSSEAGGAQNDPIRQDGIYLVGWSESKNASLRRVGKSLTRQLKLHFCRVVSEINYANLIVLPENTLSPVKLAELCQNARPSVQLIIIGKDQSVGALAPQLGPATAEEHEIATDMASRIEQEEVKNHYNRGHQHHAASAVSAREAEAIEYLKTVPTIHLNRPLRPSLIKRIMRPANLPPTLRETYKSDVVGGEEAKEEVQKQNASINSARSLDGEDEEDNTPRADGTQKDQLALKGQDLLDTDSDDPSQKILPSRRGSLAPDTTAHRTLSGRISPKSSSATLKQLHRPHAHHHHHNKRIDTEGESSASASADTTTSSSAVFRRSATDKSSATSEIADQSSIDGTSEMSDSSGMGLALQPKFRELRSGSEQTVKGGSQASSEEPLKVLVVEDNAVNRKILTTMLKRTSCQFAEAADGVEAVDQFNAFKPDLVLLDITMPRKDGFAAAAEMRHLEATLPADSTVPLEEVMKALAVTSASPSSSITTHEPSSSAIATPTPGNTNNRKDSTNTMTLPIPSTPPILSPCSSAGPLSPVSTTSSQSGFNLNPRSRKSRAKIIAVTAMSAEHQRRKGLIESGIDMWMVKPIAMRELREIVERMKEEKSGYTQSQNFNANGGGGGWSSSHNSISGGSEVATTGGRSDAGSIAN
ncbi:uncharacterized protein I303_105611 [Kwoniella dejecticola CBS 10117]|uniref:histidine kinase n=1 Tax=Kwoniella dejecticola CBS 10117 TaxID=1296121 RepID=A0A1A6A227_9TREE|nr:uncharacterized protein I303_04946 [Kwoniella dejecticola CBS 10117]OBR84089.1 hypothetical protein I303_04946 [Kwoniella dejecticola CBS 10117]